MGVDVQLDTSTEVYELGATIDGVWVPFASVPVSDVEGRRDALQAAAREAASAAPAGGGATANASNATAAPAIGGGGAATAPDPRDAEIVALRSQVSQLEAEVGHAAPPPEPEPPTGPAAT